MGLDNDSGYPYQEPVDTHFPNATPAEMDVKTVYGLGQLMRAENGNLNPRLSSIRGNFKMDENNYRSADYPMARGIANISPMAKAAMDAQDTAMWSAGWVLQSHSEGNRAMGNIAMKIASEFNSVDELNAADTKRVREVMGLPDPADQPPPPPWANKPI